MRWSRQGPERPRVRVPDSGRRVALCSAVCGCHTAGWCDMLSAEPTCRRRAVACVIEGAWTIVRACRAARGQLLVAEGWCV